MKNRISLSVLLSLLVSTLLFTGCDFWDKTNELSVTNGAMAPVIFQYRGEDYPLNPGEDMKLSGQDLPNGTYEYTSIITIPSGYEGVTGEGLSGTMEFNRGTKASLVYTSLIEGDSTKVTYEVSAALNTSNNLEQ